MFNLHPLNPYAPSSPVELRSGFTFYEPTIGEVTLTRRNSRQGRFSTSQPRLYVALEPMRVFSSDPYMMPTAYPNREAFEWEQAYISAHREVVRAFSNSHSHNSNVSLETLQRIVELLQQEQ